MLGKPVIDAAGEHIGTISDIAISVGEVFPRVTALAFTGPDKTPFMLSWRKYVEEFKGDAVLLSVSSDEIRFSYLQSDEILLSRDLLNKQIVDTQGMKVVRVNDLKLSDSANSLRLLGAEVGARGLLRAFSPSMEKFVTRFMETLGASFPETLIAWNYMDLLEHDLSQVKLSVTHKRLHELHPADVADILEQLTPAQRAAIFKHLDNEQAAETISELEEEYQADVIEDLSERRASDLLAEMEPDDAADVIGDLEYDKAERLLRLMGVEDSAAIRKLLGYKEKTAGGIMTPDATTASPEMTVNAAIEHLRVIGEESEEIHYIYVVDDMHVLLGVVSLRELLLEPLDSKLADIMQPDLFVVNPDDDQEDVAEMIARYRLLAIPVVNAKKELLGIVTFDDALEVLEEEAERDLALATGRTDADQSGGPFGWIMPRRSGWLIVWLVTLFALAVSGYSLAKNTVTVGTVTDLFGLVPLSQVASDSVASMIMGSIMLAGVGVALLPMLLIIIEESAIRAIDILTDLKPEERPSLAHRNVFAVGVGLIAGSLSGLMTFGLADLVFPFQKIIVAGLFGLWVFGVGILSSLFEVILIDRAVKRDDAEQPTSPVRVTFPVMVLCAAAVVAGGFLIPLMIGA